MNVDEALDKLFPDVIDLSKKIYSYAELGSDEIKSSSVLSEYLEKRGFRVERNYRVALCLLLSPISSKNAL